MIRNENMRMYFKFILWILRKLAKIPVDVFHFHKVLVKEAPGAALLLTMMSVLGICCFTALGLIIAGKDISPSGTYGGAYFIAAGLEILLSLSAAVSVLYDKFLLEYNKPFDILRDKEL